MSDAILREPMKGEAPDRHRQDEGGKPQLTGAAAASAGGPTAGLGRAILAGAAYFAVVFAAGFVLGALRVVVVVPRVGATVAIAMEAPIMLALSWMVCGLVLRRVSVAPRLRARLMMGATALVLLLAAELGLAIIVFGETLPAYLSSYGTLAGLLGLCAQLVFAALPLVRREIGT